MSGLGTPKDYDEALRWFILAKKNNDKTAPEYIDAIDRETQKQKTPDLNLFRDELPFENFIFFKATPDGKYIITSVTFKPDDHQTEKTAREKQYTQEVIFIWDAQTGQLINSAGQNISCFSITISPDSNFIAALNKDYQWIEIIEIPSGNIKHRLQITDGRVDLGGICFANDDQHLYISTFNSETKDNRIRLFNILTGQAVKTIYPEQQNADYSYINLNTDNKYLTFVTHNYSATNTVGTELETRILIDCKDNANLYKFKEKSDCAAVCACSLRTHINPTMDFSKFLV